MLCRCDSKSEQLGTVVRKTDVKGRQKFGVEELGGCEECAVRLCLAGIQLSTAWGVA